MPRFLTDDYLNKDPRALLTSAKMAALSENAIPINQYLTASGSDTIRIEAGCIFSMQSGGVFLTAQTELSAAQLDIGTGFAMGTDYYIYICDPGGTSDELYRISVNSSAPAGFGTQNSRQLGGFHYGQCRRVNAALQPINASGDVRGAGWESAIFAGVVPRSVWTIMHRPKCKPEGMTYLSDGVWVDIYLASDDGAGGLKSAYNTFPISGSIAGLNWYGFVERALAVGKRLLTYGEYCGAALGSPPGMDNSNDNAWTAKANVGRNNTGLVPRAVSSIGCRDAVGNLAEWLDELVTNANLTILTGSGTFHTADGGRAGKTYTNGNGHGATGAWAYDTVSPYGDGLGNIYEYGDYSLIALVAGGIRNDGVNAGSRTVSMQRYPWQTAAELGARCACAGA